MNMMKDSMGYIEVRSMVSAIEAADVMVKAAHVRLRALRKIGGAFVCVTVHGDLASCQAAVAAGAAEAKKRGTLVSAHVIARPAEDSFELWGAPSASQERKKAGTSK